VSRVVVRLPVLVVTPHSSGFVPVDVLSQMLGERLHDHAARSERLAWLFQEGDPLADVLFYSARARMWHAGVSRFVVDLDQERNEGGVIRFTDAWRRPLYPHGFELTPMEREERLRRYWDPFHEEIERSIVTHGVKLLVVGHVMRPVGPPFSLDEGRRRPALTLVTGGGPDGEAWPGRRVTVDAKRARALHHLLELHFGDIVTASDQVPRQIALNSPAAVDELSVRFSSPFRPVSVPSFGVEVNRALYLRQRDGRHYPDEAAVYALNSAFERFVRDALFLFDEAS